MPREILVVDDEATLCKALGALFSRKGIHVTTAGTAQDALQRIESINADIVLLDLKLPDASGLDVLSALREKLPDVRIVVISGNADQTMINEALERGASDYLAKPFDFDRCFYVAMGIETADLTAAEAEPQAIAKLPPELALRYQAFPIHWDGEALHLAMAEPLDTPTVEALASALQCRVVPMAVVAGDLAGAIRRHYGFSSSMGAAVQVPPAAPPKPKALPATAAPAADIDELINGLIRTAHTARATDIHLGSGPAGPWIRQRIDGILYDGTADAALKASYGAMVTRLKELGGLDVAQRRLPQQGRIVGYKAGGAKLDLLLSVMPTVHGEHLAIHLVEPSQALQFEQLGLAEDQRLAMAQLLAKSSGLILVTGPSGSGKSTSLYTFLAKLNTGAANILTIEDLVERELAGTTQIPIQPKGNLTFADGLRAIPHHDPDIVMVSEMPDHETAGLCVRTALTGRLVLSSLHTNDAASAIVRLLDLGVEPFFLCTTLTGILTQRLVRKVCPSCKEAYEVDTASLVHLGVYLSKASDTVTAWRGKGCKKCRQTGYLGRTGVFELLLVDHQIRSLILKRTPGAQIKQSAVSRGMVSLPQSIWQKVQSGVTSLEELLRILSPEQRSPEQR